MLDPLLNTKFHLPVTPHTLVDRPHLLQYLHEGLSRKLILICAPAGFGKTSLVSQWFQQTDDIQIAWLALDDADNELSQFVRYLVAALQRADESIGNATHSLLSAPQLPPVETLLTPLLNDIAEFQGQILLVLEDYHVIHTQPIHEVVSFLLLHQPPQLKLVITTRHDPPLSLGQLRVRGQILELRSADLRFRQDEIDRFFQTVMNLRLTAQEITALEKRAEGWIAGLQLAGLALQKQPEKSEFIARFTGSHDYIVDYLGEEVFKHQPAEVQAFLLQTSVLDQLNASLCNAVTGQTDSQARLEHIRQANLFLVPLDDDQQWYRYHHLFSDLLRFQAQRTYQEHLPELHRRASRWYGERGFINEAIRHALLGAHYVYVVNLLEEYGLGLVGRGRLLALKDWISALPERVLHGSPYLSVLLAWASVLIGNPTEAIRQLANAQKSVQQFSESLLRKKEIVCQIELLHGYVARSQGDLATSIVRIQRAQHDLPNDNLFLTCTVNLNLGGNFWLKGDFLAAESALQNAVTFVELPDIAYPALAATGFLANIYLHTGKLRRAEKLCQYASEVELARHTSPLPAISYVFVEQGELLYERNELDAAAGMLENAIQLGRNIDRVVNIERAMQLLALIKFAQGEKETAVQYIAEANELFEKSATRYSITRRIEFDYYRMKLWLTQGDHFAASRWTHDYEARRTVSSSWDMLNELSFARALCANRRFDTALETLTQCVLLATESQIMGWTIQGLTLKSLCLHALGYDEKALDTLCHALSLAEPEGYVRTFVDAGTPLAELLTAVLVRFTELEATDHLFSADFVSQLLALIKHESQSTSQLAEPLSDREKDVLRLLAAGLSNQEIAENLVVTIGTVRQYNHGIYRKLDVRTRDQAAQRARELRLL